MKTILPSAILAFLGVTFLGLSAYAESGTEKKTVVVAGSPPRQAYSEDHPDYLHFKEVVVTREGGQRLKFDITLQGMLPVNPKETVGFYIGFDIDSDPSTGGAAAHSAGFGQDIGVFIFQNQGDNRFRSESNSVEIKGRMRDIAISGLKVKDNKIVVDVRSELFSQFDSFKFFLSASQIRYERGKKVSDIQVHTTPVTKF